MAESLPCNREPEFDSRTLGENLDVLAHACSLMADELGQADHSGVLTLQPSLLGKLQTSERCCLQKKVDSREKDHGPTFPLEDMIPSTSP